MPRRGPTLKARPLAEIHRDAAGGRLGVVEFGRMPFVPKRLFWVEGSPRRAVRADHAHLTCGQVVVMLSGSMRLRLERPYESVDTARLRRGESRMIPPMTWTRMSLFSKDCVALFLCSEPYDAGKVLKNRGCYERALRRLKRGS